MTGHILIADSLATNRITLKVRLQAACYDVATASTLSQMEHALRERCPDLIVLGSGLTEITGVDLCRRLRTQADFSKVPVLTLANGNDRLSAMRAGANAVLDPKVDDVVLLARIRGLLRLSQSEPVHTMAEAAAKFEQPQASITLIADNPARALCWKHLLAGRLSHRFITCDPEQALAEAAIGQAADLYLIAADLSKPGEGLRLLSELRSRPHSRDAAFIIATRSSSDATSAMALDLGAGDVLPLELGGASGVEAAALTLSEQLSRKWNTDRRRAETALNMRLAMIDPLTGLHNRRYALPRLIDHVSRQNTGADPFALMIVDIDRFKSINDSFGHAAGDTVLCEIATRLRQAAGSDSMIARMGGEEFMLLVPGADEASAWDKAQQLRGAMMASPIELPLSAGRKQIPVTMSVGIAMSERATVTDTPETIAQRMIDRADRAMLAAKSMGRNRVMLAHREHAA